MCQDRRDAVALKHHEGKYLSAKKGGTITAGVGKIGPTERFVLDTCTQPTMQHAQQPQQSAQLQQLAQAAFPAATATGAAAGGRPHVQRSAPVAAVAAGSAARRTDFDALYERPYLSHLTGLNALAARREEAFAKVSAAAACH